MAARLNPRHQQMIREKIKAALLVKRLQDYALTSEENEKTIMSKGQVTAALGLLKKCVPDLVNTELNAHLDGKIQQVIEVAYVKAKQ